MFKLHNIIQNYSWGSDSALTELFNISNVENLPMAEIWMGAHPKSSSRIMPHITSDLPLFSFSSSKLQPEIEALEPLNTYLNKDLEGHLGVKAAKRFGQLPFLFKVLCAKTPLSIQVHPDLSAAQLGFERENSAKIPIDSPLRDYKDPNHKPELIYALTDFIAMNAFRTIEDILSLIKPFSQSHELFKHFIHNPDKASLAILFEGLLSLEDDEKNALIKDLKHILSLNLSDLNTLTFNHQLTWQTIDNILQIYPNDMGAFAPLLLNVVHLKAGEAMFLYANTPHAYLNGTGLEIMANSDNVLRAGLTNKHINIKELMKNVKFIPTDTSDLYMKPIRDRQSSYFPIPVDDFDFSIHNIKPESDLTIEIKGASIFFCIKGNITLKSDTNAEIDLNSGGSCFVSLKTKNIILKGDGIIAQAFYALD